MSGLLRIFAAPWTPQCATDASRRRKARRISRCFSSASASARGWFPEDGRGIYNEHTVFDADGSEYRPDRVVTLPDRTIIIDYKTGEHSDSYKYQVRRYVRLYRQMGYPSVTGHVWYLHDDHVDNI